MTDNYLTVSPPRLNAAVEPGTASVTSDSENLREALDAKTKIKIGF